MKKALLSFAILFFILFSTGCTASPAAGVGTGSTTQSSGTAVTSSSLPDSALLITGTLKLDGTDQAITKEQATDLLFLWQGYKELSTRDSAAPEEKEAILSQVKAAMTADQMSAIHALNLTARDVMELVQSLGTTTTASSSNNSSSGSSGPTFAFSAGPGGSGERPSGGPPAGGVMIQMSADGGGMPPDAIRTGTNQSGDEASSQTRVEMMATMANTLLDPLIAMLQKVIAG